MTGTVAMVSGAAGGIGAAVARALAAEGRAVALLDRDGAAVELLAKELAAEDHRVLAVPADVASPQEVEAAVDRAEAVLGPVDELVNCAGVLRTGAVLDLSDEDWDTTFAVNATGVFRLSRTVGRRMADRRSGAVVTVASNAASTARMNMAAYAASKAAATMLTKCLGLELAQYGIRCNTVAPGSTSTPMLTGMYDPATAARSSIEGLPQSFRTGIPLGRIALPHDIADAVLFLLSEHARHITMHDLVVDGGATLGV
ncbi:2,3-dihydro-2,3-dihydroxybenzoate dehydrogenase [Streptomyces sp. H34-S4]|uniref:2,3-dihydro-2,3-dihydroxybenzoate dehydrogenase n=1 Tax=Streptomyces sp. H34-S4 TaxID=2996463 RepID=UPI002270FAC6|nr:2,3-dihydro-2,3-dihydroxybenzoate dehydrogenase [Streptomyces sp. H34-S4]MCY0935125.1 2,3-dihydro-2,3-dihydroxybenzoate dehydrogenase [Streptomyces sp. H34-S4]